MFTTASENRTYDLDSRGLERREVLEQQRSLAAQLDAGVVEEDRLGHLVDLGQGLDE